MNMRMRLWAWGLGLWVGVGAGVVKADLTAIVTPGYQFPLDGSVAPSYSLLNLLGSPTIAIYGTVGGSNTLAAGSVTGVQLNSSVADAVTIGFNGNNPPGLQVLGQGVAGPGLTNNGTTGLTLWVDTNLFSLATNSPVNTNSWWQTPALTLFTNSLTGGLLRTNAGIVPGQMAVQSGTLVSGGSAVGATNYPVVTNGFVTMLSPSFQLSLGTNNWSATNGASVTTGSQVGPMLYERQFVSGKYPLVAGTTIFDLPHGFTNTPSYARFVLVCTATGSGPYLVGDECEISGFNMASGFNAFYTRCNQTNVTLYMTAGSFSPGATFQAKVYARP